MNSSNKNIVKTPNLHRITSSISSSSSSSSSSFSSNNSSLNSLEEDFFIPNTPSSSTTSSNSSKIPFSWESTPGIPKTQTFNNKTVDYSSKKLPLLSPHSKKKLPLPPHVFTTTHSNNNSYCNNSKNLGQKKSYITRNSVDPFFDALVECSKGGDEEEEDENEEDVISGGSIWKGGVIKSLSTRFGIVNCSCKSSSNIAQSLVFVPRVIGTKRVSYLKK